MKKSKVRAIVIDGRYKSIELGSIHNVEMINDSSIMLEGISRVYVPSVFAYVDENGARITTRDAIRLVGRRK